MTRGSNSAFMESQNDEQRKIQETPERDLRKKQLVRRFSVGSIRMQMGRYLTGEDIKRLRKKILGYRF